MVSLRTFVATALAEAVVISLHSYPAFAAPTAESCFAFTPATGTITNYYNYENNNSANPACPRDVEIPNDIGGVPIVAITGPSSLQGAFSMKNISSVILPGSLVTIGQNAFRVNNLTSLTIPDSVTSIGRAAFWDNNIASLTIGSGLSTISTAVFGRNKLVSITVPDTITSIQAQAFGYNELTSVELGDSVQSIARAAFEHNQIESIQLPSSVTYLDKYAFQAQSTMQYVEFDNKYYDGCSSSCEAVKEAIDSLFFTRIYTENGTSPYNLSDSYVYEEIERTGDDSWDDVTPYGGHLINPVSLKLSYNNTNDATIQQQVKYTGQLDSGTYLTNYFIAQGLEVPIPVDPWGPTPEEQAATNQALAAYFRLGQTVTITPPAIEGYITPRAQTFSVRSLTRRR